MPFIDMLYQLFSWLCYDLCGSWAMPYFDGIDHGLWALENILKGLGL